MNKVSTCYGERDDSLPTMVPSIVLRECGLRQSLHCGFSLWPIVLATRKCAHKMAEVYIRS